MTDLFLIPGIPMLLAAIAVPLLPHHMRQVWMLAAIAFSSLCLTAGEGVHAHLHVLDSILIVHRADGLTLPFAIAFHIAAGLNVIYGWHDERPGEHVAGLAYAAAAIAALHAGDLLTLFIWWEATALASVMLLVHRSRAVAMRYLLVQITSGLLLLAGAAMLRQANGHWDFEAMSLAADGMGAWLIFLAFGIKAAFPLLNGWLQDAYPEASPLGAVMLSAFTTKLAIYALARGFIGTEILIPIGLTMAVLPLFFIVLENDLRRVLAFSLNSQLGFMVVGIGIGSDLALNGAVAHAFAHIIYKSLAFMTMGAVLYRTGTVKANELGGLYRHMPITMMFCILAALAISAMPFLGSYAAKSKITSALGYEDLAVVTLILMGASAGLHAGARIVYSTFFARPLHYIKPPKRAPRSMIIAMGIAAILIILSGIFTENFYSMLPYDIDYSPFSPSKILAQFQILVFAMLAFAMLRRLGLYHRDRDVMLLNSDWFYRKGITLLLAPVIRGGLALAALADRHIIGVARRGIAAIREAAGHPAAGVAMPGPAAAVQLALLVLILGVIYAVFA